MSQVKGLRRRHKNWSEVAPSSVQFMAEAPWGYWEGLQLAHYAHNLPEYELYSNAHCLSVHCSDPTRFHLKQGRHQRNGHLFPDAISVIGAGSRYASIDNRVENEDIGIKFQLGYLENFAEENGLGPFTGLSDSFGQTDARISEIAKLLLDDLRNGSPFGRAFGDTLVNVLARHLIQSYGAAAPTGKQIEGPLATAVLRRIEEYVEAHLSEDLSLRQIATVAGYSPYHLHRSFKESTGYRLHEYVTQVRLERARQLLVATKMTVLEIALETGFSDQSHLSRQFRSHWQVTPSQIRAVPQDSPQ